MWLVVFDYLCLASVFTSDQTRDPALSVAGVLNCITCMVLSFHMIISCIIEYVSNKRTLTLEWKFTSQCSDGVKSKQR